MVKTTLPLCRSYNLFILQPKIYLVITSLCTNNISETVTSCHSSLQLVHLRHWVAVLVSWIGMRKVHQKIFIKAFCLHLYKQTVHTAPSGCILLSYNQLTTVLSHKTLFIHIHSKCCCKPSSLLKLPLNPFTTLSSTANNASALFFLAYCYFSAHL